MVQIRSFNGTQHWAYGKASKDQESAHIGFQKIANAGGPFNQNNRFLVGLRVNVTPQNNIYSQYYFGTAKQSKTLHPNAEKVKMRGWMIGADHKFNKYVSVYLEGGTGKVKQGGTELKKNHRVLVGARVMF